MLFTKNTFLNTTRITVISSFTVIVIGLVALAGWIADLDILKSFSYNWVTIKVNTAIGMILSAISLLLYASGKNKRIAFLFAAIVFLLGIVTLCEYWFQWDAYIDNILVKDNLTLPPGEPGRMTKTSAWGGVLLGLTLFFYFSHNRVLRLIASCAIVLVLLQSFVILVAYLYASSQLYKIFQLTSVSLPTIISGILISVAFIFSRPDYGFISVFYKQTSSAKLGRKAIFTGIILVILLGWLRIKGESAEIFDTSMGLSVMVVLFAIFFFLLIWLSTRKLNAAEEELAKTQMELDLIINNVEGIVWEADAKSFQFNFVSGQAERLLGYSKSKWIDDPKFWSDHIHPEDKEWAINFCINSTKNKVPHEFEYRMIAADGNIIWLRDIVTVVVENDQPVKLRGIMVDITEQKKAEKELEESYIAIRKLTDRLNHIREEERTSIAREIHDELGQNLMVMKMNADWLNNKIVDSDDVSKQRIKSLLEIVNNMVETVRRVSFDLRPSLLDDMGLSSAIEWHLDDFEKNSGVKIRFNGFDEEPKINDVIKTGLFRIFQESLTNVARHAGAKELAIDLKSENGDINMTIKDDGRGFDKEKIMAKKTLGILGMKERCTMMGGIYEISSTPGKGTMIMVKIPLKK